MEERERERESRGEKERNIERDGRIREKTDKRRKNGQRKNGGARASARGGVRVKAPSVHVRETLWSVRSCARREKEEEREEASAGEKARGRRVAHYAMTSF